MRIGSDEARDEVSVRAKAGHGSAELVGLASLKSGQEPKRLDEERRPDEGATRFFGRGKASEEAIGTKEFVGERPSRSRGLLG